MSGSAGCSSSSGGGDGCGGREVLNYGSSGSNKDGLLDQPSDSYGRRSATPMDPFSHPFFNDTSDEDNDYDTTTYTTTTSFTTFHTSSSQKSYYYNYWNAPRIEDKREVLPTSIRRWINSYKDPEREFCKIVAIFLFSFIISLQVFSYVVSMFDLHIHIPYCGQIAGQLEFECHLWLFLFAWIACFVCTAIILVLKYLLFLCRSYTTSAPKEKTT